MSNETLFFIFGIALAVSAVGFSFIGLKVKDFPGRAFPIVVAWFAILVIGSTTFAVLHAKDEDKEKAAEYAKAGEEAEAVTNDAEGAGKGTGAGEKEETESPGAGEEKSSEGAESASEEAAAAEAGEQVFASAGCVSCHTFKAANATGTVGPDLDEALTAGTEKAKIEEDIVDPNAEIAQGYAENIMPANFGETLSGEELEDLVAFLYTNSPAGK